MIDMEKVSKTEIYLAVLVGIGLTLAILAISASLVPGPQDDFAKCLTQKGVKFYGAFWCPHCAQQKEMFANSMKYVDYVECSTPDLNKTQECIDANITNYPTWQFSNGSRIVAVLPLKNLSLISGCELKNN